MTYEELKEFNDFCFGIEYQFFYDFFVHNCAKEKVEDLYETFINNPIAFLCNYNEKDFFDAIQNYIKSTKKEL